MISLYEGMDSDVVDMYGLRCAIAVLVHARHHIDDLTSAHLVRFDAAVRLLTCRRKAMSGELASNTTAILTPDPDPHGRRTVGAIDNLADMAHVSAESAPALASSLSWQPTQGTLFPPADRTG